MDRNLGKQCLAKALIDMGRHMKPSQDLDVVDSFSCAFKVRKSIADECKLRQEILRPSVRKLLVTGGAVTSDVQTQ